MRSSCRARSEQPSRLAASRMHFGAFFDRAGRGERLPLGRLDGAERLIGLVVSAEFTDEERAASVPEERSQRSSRKARADEDEAVPRARAQLRSVVIGRMTSRRGAWSQRLQCHPERFGLAIDLRRESRHAPSSRHSLRRTRLSSRWKALATALEPVSGKAARSEHPRGDVEFSARSGLDQEVDGDAADSPKRNFADIRYIAEIVSRFDVVALQEVRGDLRALRYLLKVLGSGLGHDHPPTRRRRRKATMERAGLHVRYPAREALGTGGKLADPSSSTPVESRMQLEDQFARTPYAVSFLYRAGRTVHPRHFST